jgi:hypothetical protein
MSEQQAKAYDPTTLVSEPEDAPGTLRDEEGNLLPSFDQKYADPFKGLLYLGALSNDFTWLGHDFVIRTLRDGEKLAIAQIIQPYANTMGADRAYANAVVAMAIMSLDGDDLPVPIGEPRKAHEWGLQRFNYVKDNWYPYTIDKVFNEYLLLEDLAARVMDAMGKASAPEASNRTSSAI